MTGERIILTHGAWLLEMEPGLGGATATLSHRGKAVLRPAPAVCDRVSDMAVFPLVPFANRIAHGRFCHQDRIYLLPNNVSDFAHPLHGIGWLSTWTTVKRGKSDAILRHDHGGGKHWPWPYSAEQRVRVSPRGATFSLSIISRASSRAPVGLGFHPFFPRHPRTVLKAAARAVWLAGNDCLPTERASPHHFANWRRGADVLPDMALDNCYEKWARKLTLTNGETTTIMTASPELNWLHLYIPPGAGFLCAEPVSHMPDAVNRDGSHTGARLLQPGERWSAWMRIDVA